MNNIRKHIKENNFSNIYLLYGEENYLVRTYKKLLKEAISGDDTMNYSYYEGKSIELNNIGDLSQTLPFFAERRLIILENSGFCKSASDEIIDIVKKLPDTTIIIFVEQEVDKRNRLYKYINDKGYAAEMKTPKESELLQWAFRFIKEADTNIKETDLKYFLAKTGSSMDNIYSELMKLISYVGDRGVITIADIDAVCVKCLEDHIFDMIDAMASKKSEKVLELYSELMALKVAPLKILVLVGRHFSQLYAIKELQQDNISSKEIASRLGLRPFFMERYIAQTKNFSLKALKEAMEDCVKADSDIKNGILSDQYAVETIIIKYCS